MSFDPKQFTAPEPSLNISIAIAQKSVMALLASGGLTPILYGNEVGQEPNFLVPAVKGKITEDSTLIDVSRDLADMGAPTNVPLYLQFRCVELGNRFFDAAVSVHLLLSPDPVFGLQSFLAMLGIGQSADQKTLQILSSLPNVRATASADFKALTS